MSAAAREAQWISRRTVCAGQTTFAQYSSRLLPCSVRGSPHDGHSDGGTMSRSAPVRLDSSSTPATNGITSPARRTSTVSPILIPRARITSWLASVARMTVVPPTNTGSKAATGEPFPVLPTSHSTSASTVVFSSAANLNASAPRGEFARVPAAASRSVGEPHDRAVEVVVEFVATRLDRRDHLLNRLGVVTVLHLGSLEPEIAQRRLEIALAPRRSSRSNAKNRSLRPATVFGSFARTVPAAPPRGLISGLSGFAAL